MGFLGLLSDKVTIAGLVAILVWMIPLVIMPGKNRSTRGRGRSNLGGKKGKGKSSISVGAGPSSISLTTATSSLDGSEGVTGSELGRNPVDALVYRLLLPIIDGIPQIRYLRTRAGRVEQMRLLLDRAGRHNEKVEAFDENRLVHVAEILALGTVVELLVNLRLGVFIPLLLVSIGVTYIYPVVHLKSQAKARSNLIFEELPHFFQALSGILAGGTKPEQALLRVGARLEGPLYDELRRMGKDIDVGIPAVTAFVSMAARTGVKELIAMSKRMESQYTYGQANLGEMLVDEANAVYEAIKDLLMIKKDRRVMYATGLMTFILPVMMGAILFPPVLNFYYHVLNK